MFVQNKNTTGKLIIFDLDGVLIDSKKIHFDALNDSLKEIDEKFIISKEEHLIKFDGLPTMEKLSILSTSKSLPPETHQSIFIKKQEFTYHAFSKLNIDSKLIELFKIIKDKNINIAVASNCIRKSVYIALVKLGIIEFIDFIISSDDVFRKKPFPECYWKCMIACNAIPDSTVIFEDSHIGRRGAKESKAFLIPVENRSALDEKLLSEAFNYLDMDNKNPWVDPKLNILIPMAGEGSRFANVGYTFPKPLIEVNNKPMIQVVKENLDINGKYTFIVKEDHYEKYNLNYLLELIAPKCNIVRVNKTTEGAACTTLLAEEFINNENPLLIANSDQYVEWDSQECMYYFSDPSIDAGIVTFQATHPKWSYAKLDQNNKVIEVAEKKPISTNATVGIYYWKRGSDYVKYAKQMIKKNIRTNGEFYVCPVFNEAIKDDLNIKVFHIDKMWGIGTPEDLNIFIENKVLK